MTHAAAALALALAGSDLRPSGGAPEAQQEGAAAYAFQPAAAAAALGGLVLVDAAVAGTSLAIAAAAHADDLGAGMAMAAIVTGAGIFGAVYGPGVGGGFAAMVDGRARGFLPWFLAYACQAGSLALAVAAAAESGNGHVGRSHGLLAGAAALHFVGIPLALGISRAPPGHRGGAATVASLSLAW